MVKAWRLRAEIALARRDLDDAEGALHEALVVASAIGNPTQLWKTHAAWGRLHAARQHPDAAREAYRAAGAVLEHVQAGLRDPGLRTSLAEAPAVRQVTTLAGLAAIGSDVTDPRFR
jgi:hypothetical protein